MRYGSLCIARLSFIWERNNVAKIDLKVLFDLQTDRVRAVVMAVPIFVWGEKMDMQFFGETINTISKELAIAISGGFCHYAYNGLVGKYKRVKLEKKYPVDGEYISKYEDEVNGAIVWRRAHARLHQHGDKITGKTQFGDTTWTIEGRISGYHVIGRYSAESHFNAGVGTFFLRIRDNGILDGIWSGFDAENSKVTNGRYIFKRKLYPQLLPIERQVLPSILRIAEKQLGDSYVSESSLLGEGRFGYYATIAGKPAGFCVGRLLPVQKFLDLYQKIKERGVRSLGLADTLGLITCIAVDEDYKERGVGNALIDRCASVLVAQGAQVLASTGWKSSNGVHIGGLMKMHGFEQLMEIPDFWKEDSVTHNYKCPECGPPPCHCSAVFYVKHLTGGAGPK
jgi:ribosomal protein S18 acetylase RimI-like enzyme